MKKLLMITLLLFVGSAVSAQGISLSPDGRSYIPSPSTMAVISKSDTTVLNKGKDDCNHKFPTEIAFSPRMTCLVMHDMAGCPDDWPKYSRICTICLRHENIKTTYRVSVLAEYKEVFKGLKQ